MARRPGRRRPAGLGTRPTTDYSTTCRMDARWRWPTTSSPAFVARAMNASRYRCSSTCRRSRRPSGATAASRGGAHHPCLFAGTEWFFRTGLGAELGCWIAALGGVADKPGCRARASPMSGCGHGAWVVAMAEAFPAADASPGIDLHAPWIAIGAGCGPRRRASPSGPTFGVADGDRLRRARST